MKKLNLALIALSFVFVSSLASAAIAINNLPVFTGINSQQFEAKLKKTILAKEDYERIASKIALKQGIEQLFKDRYAFSSNVQKFTKGTSKDGTDEDILESQNRSLEVLWGNYINKFNLFYKINPAETICSNATDDMQICIDSVFKTNFGLMFSTNDQKILKNELENKQLR